MPRTGGSATELEVLDETTVSIFESTDGNNLKAESSTSSSTQVALFVILLPYSTGYRYLLVLVARSRAVLV